MAVAILATFTTIGLAACSDARDPVSPAPNGSRPGATPSNLVRANTPSISMLSFEVSSPSLPSPLLYDIPLTNGGTNASLRMPAGKEYTITVRGYDRYGTQTHVGGVSLPYVLAGSNPAFEMSLKPVTDSALAASIQVGVVGESVLPTGGRIVIKGPTSVEQGATASYAAEVVASDGSIIPIELGDLHWAVSDPSGGTATPDPVQPRLMHLSSNLAGSFNVSVLYHNYQSAVGTVVFANYFVQVSASANYTCGVRLSGTLFCWGENGPNQLLGSTDAVLQSSHGGVPCKGDVSQTCVTTPLQIAVGHLFTQVSAGPTGACAIEKGTGTAYCWGNNGSGFLGVPTSASGYAPPTPLSASLSFQQISAGGTHYCGISNGYGYCWGDDTNGEIGDGNAYGSYGQVGGTATPYQLAGYGWTQISAGNGFTCGIINSVAKCWGGLDDYYVVGAGVADHWSPAAVSTTYGSAVPSQLGAASNATTMCAIMPQGGSNPGAWCWGHHIGGSYSPGGDYYLPTQLSGASVLTQTASGVDHTCGLDGSGNALCWGNNGSYQGGQTSPSWIGTLTQVNAGTTRFVSIAAGDNHTCAATNTGGVYCWGANNFGQFGDNDMEYAGTAAPTRVWGTNP